MSYELARALCCRTLYRLYKISREFEHADCVMKYKKLVIEISTDGSSSVSEHVFGSDIEREPKSDFKRGRKFVFDFVPS